jgi:hypothetical protein
MSQDLGVLLHGIVDQEDLIRAWAVEVGPGGSSLRVQTRRSFRRREDALSAARLLLGELVRNSRQEVRGAVPGTAVDGDPDGQEWRGIVDVELGPL